MPSSSFISPLGSTQRKVFDPRTGIQVPYKPYMTLGQRLPRVFAISKIRKPNPFLIGANNFSHY